MAVIPAQVSNELHRILSTPENRTLLVYLIGVSNARSWDVGISHDQMLINEGQRLMASDLLLAARIGDYDPKLLFENKGERNDRAESRPEPLPER